MPISDAQLLSVARLAYTIPTFALAADPVIASVPFLDGANAPHAFLAGLDDVDAALVGETPDEIVIAFRGTEPIDKPSIATFLDWLNDFDAILVHGDGLPGNVHQGFQRSISQLWGRVETDVKARLSPGSSKPIVLTGHSKGGGIAYLGAVLASAAFFNSTIRVVTFAAPRAGDATFAAGYQKIIPAGQSTRYEFGNDIVPHVPPSEEFFAAFKDIPFISSMVAQLNHGFVSVGELEFIFWDEPAAAGKKGSVVGDSPGLDSLRIGRLVGVLATFNFDEIAGSHSIASDEVGPPVSTSGYARAFIP